VYSLLHVLSHTQHLIQSPLNTTKRFPPSSGGFG